MFKHDFPPEVIAALACFCIGGLALTFAGLFFSDLQNHSGTIDFDSDLMWCSLLGSGGIAIVFSAFGYLNRRRWAAFIMTLLAALVSAATIVYGLFIFESFALDLLDALLYLLGMIGVPLTCTLFFSSTRIFPWLEPSVQERHEDIIDQI